MCRVRAHTSDSRAGRTTHKMYCTKEPHRRWLALAGTGWGSAVARFVQYGDCIGTLLPRSERTPISTARQARHEADVGLPRPLRHGTPAPPLRYDKRCQPKAVAQRL